MSVVDDVMVYIVAQNSPAIVGGATGWDIFRRRMTDEPSKDQVVVVSEDGGPEPEIKTSVGIGNAAVSDAGVLVSVRGKQWDGDSSKNKAFEIWTLLHGKRNIQLVAPSGTTYYRIRALTPEPIFAGFDDTGRPRHTVGFRLLAALT